MLVTFGAIYRRQFFAGSFARGRRSTRQERRTLELSHRNRQAAQSALDRSLSSNSPPDRQTLRRKSASAVLVALLTGGNAQSAERGRDEPFFTEFSRDGQRFFAEGTSCDGISPLGGQAPD